MLLIGVGGSLFSSYDLRLAQDLARAHPSLLRAVAHSKDYLRNRQQPDASLYISLAFLPVFVDLTASHP